MTTFAFWFEGNRSSSVDSYNKTHPISLAPGLLAKWQLPDDTSPPAFNSGVFLQELKDELIRVRDDSLKQLHLKEKQIEQLVNGFQKQMQLIDVLRRQKVNGF